MDFLPETVGAYSISVDPAPQAVRRYTDGGSLRQLEFTLSGRESYGPETLQQLENSGFYQRLGQWMEERSQAGLLPALPEGQKGRRPGGAVRRLPHRSGGGKRPISDTLAA